MITMSDLDFLANRKTSCRLKSEIKDGKQKFAIAFPRPDGSFHLWEHYSFAGDKTYPNAEALLKDWMID